MNREDIIRMGQEVYLCDEEGRDDNSIIIVGHLERFAALVASAERDRMCEQFNLSKELAHEKAKSNETN